MAINNQGHLDVTTKETGYNDVQFLIAELKVSEYNCIFLTFFSFFNKIQDGH